MNGIGTIYRFYKNGVEVGKTKNILTDGFFSKVFGGPYTLNDYETGTYICIFLGTGTTPVSRTDTAMEAYVAKSAITDKLASSGRHFDVGQTVNGRYYRGVEWAVTFGAGVFSGQDITEIGARFSDPTGTTFSRNSQTDIDSHALITDENGNVVPIHMEATDSLAITAEFWQQMPDMRYDASRVVIQGVATDISFGFVNTTDSVAENQHCILNPVSANISNSTSVCFMQALTYFPA